MERHYSSNMGPFYLIIALLIQNAYTETQIDSTDNQIESRKILKIKPDSGDEVSSSEHEGPKDWMDMFIEPETIIYPTSSAALMAQASGSNKTPEEQLDDIKQMAEQISSALQSEMANLLSYAISITDKHNVDNNTLRRKRSVETPMDSTQLVMRLLKHIKSNNEYQNIAIEKMMTAQQIADKYGIDFNPDPEILSDLAVAANEQAKEMSDILKDSLNLNNMTTTLNDTVVKDNEADSQSLTNAHQQNNTRKLTSSDCKVVPELNHNHPDSFSHYNHYYNSPYESQIVTPPHQHQNAPVSPRPNFYDYVSYNPEEFSPYCSMEMSPIFLPIDEPILVEPELVGEEFEEIVSSKVCVDHDEPGFSTVNHVMTYTVSEKAHFRTPQIENLPQQMQYYFFLM